MNTSNNSSIIVLIIAILVLGAGAYMLFGVPKQFELQSDSSPISEAEAVFITLTNQINPVQFDTSILADPRFKVLRDLKTPIFEEVTGRADPFGPLPGVKQQ